MLKILAVATVLAAPLPLALHAETTSVKPTCPNDHVVWLNTKSRIYHYRDMTTAQGHYACERDAIAQGGRASKREVAPDADVGADRANH